jgi:two-component system cell cycle response regulator DivK
MDILSIELDDLREDYYIDLDEKLQYLEEHAYGDDAEEIRSNIKKIASKIHSIKGSAGLYQLLLVSNICHHFESYMTASGASWEKISKKLLRCIDAIREILIIYKRGEIPDEKEYLIKIGFIKKEELRKKVLVIGNSSVYQRTVIAALRGLNVHFSLCHDIPDALWKIIKNDYDLVITSAVAEEGSITPFLGAVKYLDKTAPKIVLTTSSSNFELPDGLSVDHVIKKDKDFIQNLRSLFSNKQEKQDEKINPFKKIVYVDDDASTVALMQHFLKKEEDVDAHFFTSATQALDFMKLYLPDVIITDLQMPGLSGSEFIDIIKNTDALKALPIIVLTSPSESGDQLLEQKDISGVINKPFKASEIYSLICEVAQK